MMKKITYIVLLIASAPLIALRAQMPPTSTAVSGASGSNVAYPTIVPVPQPIGGGDIIQFNNLTVQSVSSQTPPAEIVATAGYPVPLPMMQSGGGVGQGNTLQPFSPTTSPQTPGATCFRFERGVSSAGVHVNCPTPPTPTQTPSSPQSGIGAGSYGSTTPSQPSQPAIYPWPPSYSYRIEITEDTRLYLRDRSSATLSDFSQGDRINVFGFYNPDGTIQAMVVRNLSKPVQKTFYQLNNVELVSVSASTTPATLIVVQRPIYPCYWFGEGGASPRRPYPCPLGLQSPSQSPMMQGMQVPQSLMPVWNLIRKYEVHVDSQTILIDRIRNMLSLSQLRQGDKLNIYGEMEGDNGPIDADIIRDLSQPPAVSWYEGRVTQVNSDGSFIMQTNDGQLVTVYNPVTVGATVRLRGLLNELQKVISEISQIIVNNNLNYQQPQPEPVQPPIPAPLPQSPQPSR